MRVRVCVIQASGSTSFILQVWSKVAMAAQVRLNRAGFAGGSWV
jgi:hypothetical protein